jgi:hypothetical protein
VFERRRGSEGDLLLRELVVHVVLGEVRLVLEDEAEHEHKTGDDESADREDDVEGATGS